MSSRAVKHAIKSRSAVCEPAPLVSASNQASLRAATGAKTHSDAQTAGYCKSLWQPMAYCWDFYLCQSETRCALLLCHHYTNIHKVTLLMFLSTIFLPNCASLSLTVTTDSSQQNSLNISLNISNVNIYSDHLFYILSISLQVYLLFSNSLIPF